MKRILKNKYGKKRDWREPYRKSRRFDITCRCHGGCPYCLGSRFHSIKKKELSIKEKIKDFKNNNEVDMDDN